MNTQNSKTKKIKQPGLAVILNLIPFIGLGGCAVQVRSPSSSSLAELGGLWFFILIWGIGYLYLGRWVRFLLSMLIPWVSCFASSSFGLDFEHGRGETANFFAWLLMVASICVITAVDAYRLAVANNARIDNIPQDNSIPPGGP